MPEVTERKVNRNYSVWFRTDEGRILKWNDSLIHIQVHNVKPENQTVEFYVDVIEQEHSTFLVYEAKTHTAVESVAKEILKEYGHKWNRVFYADIFSQTISTAYDRLGQIQRGISFNHPYSRDLAQARDEYKRITESIEYRLYKTHIDPDQLQTEQYEDYYRHIMQVVADHEK